MANKSHVFSLPGGQQIILLYLPAIDLYVISDAKGFGPNWIQVTYCSKVYQTNLLAGVDNDSVLTSIARFMAEKIVKKKLSSSRNELTSVQEITITFSISLRNIDSKMIRLIREEFDKELPN